MVYELLTCRRASSVTVLLYKHLYLWERGSFQKCFDTVLSWDWVSVWGASKALVTLKCQLWSSSSHLKKCSTGSRWLLQDCALTGFSLSEAHCWTLGTERKPKGRVPTLPRDSANGGGSRQTVKSLLRRWHPSSKSGRGEGELGPGACRERAEPGAEGTRLPDKLRGARAAGPASERTAKPERAKAAALPRMQRRNTKRTCVPWERARNTAKLLSWEQKPHHNVV